MGVPISIRLRLRWFVGLMIASAASQAIDLRHGAASDGDLAAYVANTGDSSVTVISLATREPIGLLCHSGLLADLEPSPDGGHVYVTTFDPGELLIIEGSSATVERRLPLTSPAGNIAVRRDGRRAVVVHPDRLGSVSVVDLIEPTVEATIRTPPNPRSIALAPEGLFAFLSHGSVAVSSVVDPEERATFSFPLPSDQGAGVAVTQDGAKAYVAHAPLREAPSVSVIDALAREFVGSVPLPAKPAGMAHSPKVAELYVASGSSISVIDTTADAVIATIPAGTSLQRIAFHSEDDTVFVTDYEVGEVVVIDAAARVVSDRIPVGPNPLAIAVARAPASELPTCNPSATPTPTAATSPSPTLSVPTCAGECGGEGIADVEEVTYAVRVALHERPYGGCAAADLGCDGEVTVEEIIAAVVTRLRSASNARRRATDREPR